MEWCTSRRILSTFFDFPPRIGNFPSPGFCRRDPNVVEYLVIKLSRVLPSKCTHDGSPREVPLHTLSHAWSSQRRIFTLGNQAPTPGARTFRKVAVCKNDPLLLCTRLPRLEFATTPFDPKDSKKKNQQKPSNECFSHT